jgi:transcriptional regulator with XRE-family HTH domain
MPDMTLAERIREAIQHSGKTQAQIATETGKSPGAVTQWLDGATKSLRADTAAALERATGYNATEASGQHVERWTCTLRRQGDPAHQLRAGRCLD